MPIRNYTLMIGTDGIRHALPQGSISILCKIVTAAFTTFVYAL
jgi:hypothetical protein